MYECVWCVKKPKNRETEEVGGWLRVAGCWLLVCWLRVAGLLVAGLRVAGLLVAGCLLLVTGCGWGFVTVDGGRETGICDGGLKTGAGCMTGDGLYDRRRETDDRVCLNTNQRLCHPEFRCKTIGMKECERPRIEGSQRS